MDAQYIIVSASSNCFVASKFITQGDSQLETCESILHNRAPDQYYEKKTAVHIKNGTEKDEF